VPAHSHALARRPTGDFQAHGVDRSYYPMARDARVLETPHGPLFGQRIAVADAASLHFDSYRARSRIGNFPIDDCQSRTGSGNWNGAHFAIVLPPPPRLLRNKNIDCWKQRGYTYVFWSRKWHGRRHRFLPHQTGARPSQMLCGEGLPVGLRQSLASGLCQKFVNLLMCLGAGTCA
jgi:hypothetical protein